MIDQSLEAKVEYVARALARRMLASPPEEGEPEFPPELIVMTYRGDAIAAIAAADEWDRLYAGRA